MAKGSIRAYAIATFNSLLHLRAEVGDTVYRKTVMRSIETVCNCTNAAAAAHYNYALQLARKETPEKVRNLGRPEGKNNGGRKRASTTQHVVALLGWNGQFTQQ